MGQLTVTEIVDAGMREGGNTNLSANSKLHLKAWLRSQYRGFAWPFLKLRASLISLPTGTTSKVLGSGNGGITPKIQYVTGRILVFTSDKRTRSFGIIQNMQEALDPATDPDGLDATSDRGIPNKFMVRQVAAADEAYGRVTLYPYPIPDKDYVISFEFLYLPTDPNDNAAPIYPNDRTMIQMVKTYVLSDSDKKKEYKLEMDILAVMVAEDRMKYGQIPGTNDTLPLDPDIFR